MAFNRYPAMDEQGNLPDEVRLRFASNLRLTGSPERAAVSEVVDDAVAAQNIPQKVAAAVAAAPTVTAAAATAVSNEIATRRLADYGGQDEPNVVYALVDKNDNRTWIEVAPDGGPSDYSVLLFRSRLGDTLPTPIPEVAELAYSVADQFDTRTWIEAGWDGRPTLYSVGLFRDVLDRPAGNVAYGDSTTQGTNVDGIPAGGGWVELLAADIGQAIDNKGAAGARAEEVTARAGGVVPTALVTNSVIPASGAVILTDFDVDAVRSGDITSYTVDLRTSAGVVVRGSIQRYTETVNGNSVSRRRFVRDEAGSEIAAPGRVEMHSVSGALDRRKLVFLGQGINNEPLIVAGTQTIEDVKRWYRDATTALQPARLVVWGVLDRGPAERPAKGSDPGTTVGNYIRDLEAWLEQTYGVNFAPYRQYLTTPQALLDAQAIDSTYSPTQADLDAQAVGTVPPSFRTGSGSVHMGVLGHKLQARYMKRWLSAPQRGWV